jgi:hypothetical protein
MAPSWWWAAPLLERSQPLHWPRTVLRRTGGAHSTTICSTSGLVAVVTVEGIKGVGGRCNSPCSGPYRGLGGL